MAERENQRADNRKQRFAAIVRLGERKGHHPQPDDANAEGKKGTVRPHALPEAERTQSNRKHQPDLVDQRVKKNAASGRHKGQHKRRDNTMGNA